MNKKEAAIKYRGPEVDKRIAAALIEMGTSGLIGQIILAITSEDYKFGPVDWRYAVRSLRCDVNDWGSKYEAGVAP